MNDQSAAMVKQPVIEQLRASSDVAKNVVSLLRDVIIVVLLVLFLWNAGQLTQWMRTNNIESLSILGIAEVKAKQTVKEATEALDANADVQEEMGWAIQEIEKLHNSRPELASQLAPILRALQVSRSNAMRANRNIASAGIRQQQVLAAAKPEKPAVEGWVSRNFLANGAKLREGQISTVIPPRPLRLRAGPGTASAILDTIFPSTRVRILDAPDGNWVSVSTDVTQ